MRFAVNTLLVLALFHCAAHAVPITLQPAERLQERDWKALYDRNLAEAEKGPYDIVFIGDSITQRWHNAPNVRTLKAVFGESTRTLNLGIYGDRTQHILWRMDRMPWEKIAPKAIVLMIGTNNTGNKDSTVEEIYAGIEAIVAQLRKKAPQAKIMLMAIFPRETLASHPFRIHNSQVNALLPKLADNQNIFFFDIAPRFLLEDGATLNRALVPDGVHLEAEGQGVWARAIAPTLLQWIGKKE